MTSLILSYRHPIIYYAAYKFLSTSNSGELYHARDRFVQFGRELQSVH